MNKWIIGIVFILCIGLAEAKLFDIDNTVMPTFMGCSITGCTMTGPIDMNGNAIYNASLVNPSLVEFDPIFTAENGTIWQAINSKLNITDQRYNDTALIILVNDSLYIELGNYYTSAEIQNFYYNKTESDNRYYPLNSNPAGYINESYANNSYYPRYDNPEGYLTNTTLSNVTGPWVLKAGDNMTGNLSMGNNSILGVDVLEVHNITGRSPVYISSPVISYTNISSPVFYASESVVITSVNITATTFYGNIQGTNGTIYGVTITNGTIRNLHVNDSAIFNTNLTPEINYTYSLGTPDLLWRNFYVGDLYASNISSPDIDNLYNITNQLILDLAYKLNITDQRYNDTAFIINELLNYYNTSEIDFMFANFTYNETDPIFVYENVSIWNAINAINASIKQPSGPYLANDSTQFWINESALNYTINDIAKVRSLNYTITGLSGPGSVLSGINISYEITQIIVIPGSNSTNYRFTLTEYPSGDVIDENRAVHSGVWNIRKSYSLNSVVNATIVTSTPADTYTIIIKYLWNGVQ